MKKTAVVALLMIVVMLVSATSGFAWVRGGGGVRHGGWNGHGGGHGGHGDGVGGAGPGRCWGPWGGRGWGGFHPGPDHFPQTPRLGPPPPVLPPPPPAPP